MKNKNYCECKVPKIGSKSINLCLKCNKTTLVKINLFGTPDFIYFVSC